MGKEDKGTPGGSEVKLVWGKEGKGAPGGRKTKVVLGKGDKGTPGGSEVKIVWGEESMGEGSRGKENACKCSFGGKKVRQEDIRNQITSLIHTPRVKETTHVSAMTSLTLRLSGHP